MIDFWKDSFWLPSNTSWKDIENGPDKTVVYGTVQDLWVQVPLVAMMFALRYFCQNIIFKSFGKYLNISDGKRRRAPENGVLEALYRKSTKLKDLSQIAKKVDMTERQVERWWRLRRSQDKPSTLVKFCESMWKGSVYLSKEGYAVSILWSKDWVWNIDLCLEGYPHQGITNDVKRYYMISLAFYGSLTISQFYDVKRKDFWQMFVHHIATIILITCSWICNLHRMGSLVLIVLDCSDIFLEFSKAAKYARAENLANCIFGIFVSLWMCMRLYVFPVYILFRTYEASLHTRFYTPIFMVLNALLCFLMVLNLIWTCIIADLAIKRLFRGELVDDSRSSCSEISSTDNESSKIHNNNKLKTN